MRDSGRIRQRLIDCLASSISGDAGVCTARSDDMDSVVATSPFVLSVAGIILFQASGMDSILDLIIDKINSLYSCREIYNFYGDDTYHYDVDTTASTHTFLKLTNRDRDQKEKLVEDILDIQDDESGAIWTWFDREPNRIDWFVNYNVHSYLTLIGCENNNLRNYLTENMNSFIRSGSHYYRDLDFPLFLIMIHRHLHGNSFAERIYSRSLRKPKSPSKSDILSIALKHFFHQKKEGVNPEEMIDRIRKVWKKDTVYFTSSSAVYTSRFLNAAIALFLIDKLG